MIFFQILRDGTKYELWVPLVSGSCQVTDFLKTCGVPERRRMFQIVITTIMEGKYQNKEIYREIGDGIWEFKAAAIRLYSFDDGKRIVLTHAGRKPKSVNADHKKATAIRKQYFAWKEKGSQE